MHFLLQHNFGIVQFTHPCEFCSISDGIPQNKTKLLSAEFPNVKKKKKKERKEKEMVSAEGKTFKKCIRNNNNSAVSNV